MNYPNDITVPAHAPAPNSARPSAGMKSLGLTAKWFRIIFLNRWEHYLKWLTKPCQISWHLSVYPSVAGAVIFRENHTMTSSNGNIFRVTGHLRGEVTRSFDVFFDLRLNKRLSKQSWGWWLETITCPLWRHCNAGKWHGCWCLAPGRTVARSSAPKRQCLHFD